MLLRRLFIELWVFDFFGWELCLGVWKSGGIKNINEYRVEGRMGEKDRGEGKRGKIFDYLGLFFKFLYI